MIQHQNWSATSIGGNVRKGQEVLVVSVSGVRLMVSPVDESG
jgi:membrane-bound ClpP family serine protease